VGARASGLELADSSPGDGGGRRVQRLGLACHASKERERDYLKERGMRECASTAKSEQLVAAFA